MSFDLLMVHGAQLRSMTNLFPYLHSGLESMGQEIKGNGRFWRRGVQTDALC